MADPADTIREALTQASVTLDLYGKAVLSRECYDALAALTELEQQLANTVPVLAAMAEVARERERADAAEADRDRLQAELDDALDELNEARAALATPDTPPTLTVTLEPGTYLIRGGTITRAAPETPPDA